VVAILVGERDCPTQFWKRTIQWLFHQSLVLIELLVPDKMVFMWIPIGSYVKLSTAVQPSWSEGGTSRHNFGRGPSNDYLIKVWFQLSNWFQTRRCLCEFPIGSYVTLSSAVGAILVEGPNRWTHFWKRTIQWIFHQNFVLIEQLVSDKTIFMGISHRVPC
jgi:hypothetical protein